MILLLPLVTLAHAQPLGFIVEVSDPEHLLDGMPLARVKDARGDEVALTLHDDGVAPDPTAGDQHWAGGTTVRLVSPYTLTIQSAAGKVWTSTLAAPNPDEPGLTVAPHADGTIVSTLGVAPTLTPTPPSTPDAEPQASGAVAPGGTALGLTWLAALGTLAWALAARLGPVPRSLPGGAPALPGRGRVCVRGDVGALVGALVRSHRVVLVGPLPAGLADEGDEEPGPSIHGTEGGLPAGSLFPVGPGRVAMEDVLEVVGGLQGRGAPLVVVLAGPLEGGGPDGAHRAAARRLAAHLPPGVVLYDFEDGPATWVVDPEGRLTPL